MLTDRHQHQDLRRPLARRLQPPGCVSENCRNGARTDIAKMNNQLYCLNFFMEVVKYLYRGIPSPKNEKFRLIGYIYPMVLR